MSIIALVAALGCTRPAENPEASHLRETTLLYTNDFESAYDPIPAFPSA